MATEYYQIPSSQGHLALDTSADNTDPWLAATTSALSLDWNTKSTTKQQTPPSLFDSDDAEALSWKTVVPQQSPKSTSPTLPEKEKKEKQQIVEPIKAPKAKQFISTFSKIDAWTVVANASAIAVDKQKLETEQPQPIPEETDEEKATVEEELAHQNRYKTELCKSFTETGICRYGMKCQFAHGKDELRRVMRHPKYKTEICKTFHSTGTCPYGMRCRFIHTKSKEESIYTMAFSEPQDLEDEQDIDEILSSSGSKVTPPGVPVPQWSKSWIPTTAGLNFKKPSSKKHESIAVPEPSF